MRGCDTSRRAVDLRRCARRLCAHRDPSDSPPHRLLQEKPSALGPRWLPQPVSRLSLAAGLVPGQQRLPDPGSLQPLLHADPPRLRDEEASAPEQRGQRAGSTPGSAGLRCSRATRHPSPCRGPCGQGQLWEGHFRVVIVKWGSAHVGGDRPRAKQLWCFPLLPLICLGTEL